MSMEAVASTGIPARRFNIEGTGSAVPAPAEYRRGDRHRLRPAAGPLHQDDLLRGRPSARQISEQMCAALQRGIEDRPRLPEAREVHRGRRLHRHRRAAVPVRPHRQGNEKAAEALERNQYVGPAPVPFDEYVEVVHEQSVRQIRVDADVVDAALGDLVLNDTTRSLVGPAVNSGRSLLLYGDPGNGKSSIAKGIGRMLHGEVLIPYAIDVGGQTIRVFDPRVHHGSADSRSRRSDAGDVRAAVAARAPPRPALGGRAAAADHGRR